MMKSTPSFATLLQRYFTERLMQQRQASPHTISSYRDTFRLLLQFARKRLRKSPANMKFEDIDAPLIGAFLDDLQTSRGIGARSRNIRLAAIRSFFNFVAFEMPAQSAQIQRVLAIPTKRFTRVQISFLTHPEVDALLAVPSQKTWSGRRDHALLLVTVQTGARLSEITALKREDVSLGAGAHIHVIGKGRKERCTPLTKQTVAVLKSWLQEPVRGNSDLLFPNARGGRLSADGMAYILAKHLAVARQACPSLKRKHVTPHVLRHTAAMALLQAGVDTSLIALWLGHESVETTQIYLNANLALKEKILAKATHYGGRPGSYRPDDKLLAFLSGL
jgi:site-specific recombinase XerD